MPNSAPNFSADSDVRLPTATSRFLFDSLIARASVRAILPVPRMPQVSAPVVVMRYLQFFLVHIPRREDWNSCLASIPIPICGERYLVQKDLAHQFPQDGADGRQHDINKNLAQLLSICARGQRRA